MYCGLLVLANSLHAQSDYRPGYVVSHQGDTVYGEIDYRGDLMMGSACRLKSGESVFDYTPEDITAFRFTDSRYYVSRAINGGNFFLEYLVNGELNIYYLRDKTGDHYFLEKDGMELKEIPYKESIVYADNTPRFYNSTKHMGLLYYYMQDAPGFQQRIYKLKKPDHHNLIDLAEDYHNAVCKDEQCIIYERPMPFISLSLEPLWGYVQYHGYGKPTQNLGCNLYMWIPLASEKIYFKTGLHHQKFSEEGDDWHLMKIPLQLQYIYEAHIIQPKASFGVNLYTVRLHDFSSITHTLSLNAGINVRINKSISLSTGFNSDYTPVISLLMGNTAFGYISCGFDVGLWIKL